jgi:hypothetical protein
LGGRRHGLAGVFGVLHATHETHSNGLRVYEEVERLDDVAVNGNVTRNHSAASIRLLGKNSGFETGLCAEWTHGVSERKLGNKIEEEINNWHMLVVYWAYCAIKSDVRIGQQLPFYDHRKKGVPSRRIDIRAGHDLILSICDLAQKREWGRSDIRDIHDIRMQPMNQINTGRPSSRN